ncbi:ferritin-like domain-containing protein [Nakamurella sp. GG22]
MSRQDFVRGQQAFVSAPQALGALNNRWALAAPGDFASDVDVLNYALTLEYLEAAFYQQGNAAGLLDGVEKEYLASIQSDEEYHVKALSDTITKLGGTPVAAPGVDFAGAFADRNSYLTTSVTFENVGVGAYLGAAGYIKDKAILQAAAGIFGVEARHAAVVASLLNLPAEGGVYKGAFEKPISKADVLTAVTPFLAQMSGGMPSGAPETGGGSTAGTDNNTGLIVAGGAALLGAAAYAGHRATSRDVAEDPQS